MVICCSGLVFVRVLLVNRLACSVLLEYKCCLRCIVFLVNFTERCPQFFLPACGHAVVVSFTIS